jgi:putative PEP-CTERM system histidine kinase
LAAVVSGALNLACALAYALLLALMSLRGRTSRTGAVIAVCCVLSTLWALLSAFRGVVPAGAPNLFDSLRLSAWLWFAAAVIWPRASRRGHGWLLGAMILCAATAGYDLQLLLVDADAARYHPLRDLLHTALDVAGLLAVENLWRNTVAERRWYVWPLCLPIGAIFAYDLFLSADALMTRSRIASELLPGRAIIATFGVPLLALAMTRNREWRIDIHVSRKVVLHTATLTASGLFLLAVGSVGMLLHRLGGVWSVPLQLMALIGSAFVLGIVLSSSTFWRRLKFFISHNFFSNRYDYRVEWLRFVDAVSNPRHAEELPVRIVRALAEFVDSPSGVLWSLVPGVGFRPTAAWMQPPPEPTRLAAGHPFIRGFRDGSWIQLRPPDAAGEAWPAGGASAWLAVPLARAGMILAFVLLNRPNHKVALDWEAFDLLRSAGSQAASYLAEERSTRLLLEAELLNSYTQRFAFVVHDIKNLASELGLIVTNARRYIDDPEFQRDMLQTIDESVARMNHLLSQLNAGPAAPTPTPVYPGPIIDRITAGFSQGAVIVERPLDDPDCAVAIEAERLGSALTHLVQNAIDASPPGEPVVVRSSRRGSELVIDVVDRGGGMDSGFVRDELFLPLRSTKSGGHGIGAFQTRELIRSAGGDVDVISEKGIGTTMRLVLPLLDAEAALHPPAAA